MNDRSLTFPVLLSFAELALLAVFSALCVNAFRSQTLKARLLERDRAIERLTAQADSMSTQQADLRNRLAGRDAEISRYREELKTGQQERGSLQASLHSNRATADRLLMEAKAAHQERAALEVSLHSGRAELADWQARLIVSRERLTRLLALEKHVRLQPRVAKAVLGLKGELDRVVILFDCSGSMAKGDRWQHAKELVQTWLMHLDIGECALVTFSTTAKVFTSGGRTYFDLRGREGDANRELLARHIATLQPKGGTNTLQALELAYGLKSPQTILLFSDGAPNDGRSGGFDPKVAKAIYGLCCKHKNTVVNTVALGHYFEAQLGSFMMRVARETNGAYLGR